MINKAILLGRIGKKDYKPTKNGSFICRMSIATYRRHLDSHCKQIETTTWHYVNFFGEYANIANKYGEVGDLVYVEGEISNKKMVDEAGKDKWMYSIVGNEIKRIPTGNMDHISGKDGSSMGKADLVSDMTDDESIPF